jgi:hypothetical protein
VNNLRSIHKNLCFVASRKADEGEGRLLNHRAKTPNSAKVVRGPAAAILLTSQFNVRILFFRAKSQFVKEK